MTSRLALLSFILFTVLAAACSPPPPPEPSGDSAIQVFVSIPPQKFLVQRIAGDLVSVDVMLPPGQSPATYEPTPQQMSRLASAGLFFRIGVPFEERLMGKISDQLPELEVVDTREGLTLRQMEGADHHGHDHHHGDHVHEAGAPDPHTWLDPRLAVIQASTIHDALIGLLPQEKAVLNEGLASLTRDLEAVDHRMAEALEPLRGRTIYVFHPAYGYLADAYGLTQVAVEIEGKEPSAKQMADLITRARADQVGAIFFQPQFSRNSAEILAREIGCAAVELDPLAEDYLANLELMAKAINTALESGTN